MKKNLRISGAVNAGALLKPGQTLRRDGFNFRRRLAFNLSQKRSMPAGTWSGGALAQPIKGFGGW